MTNVRTGPGEPYGYESITVSSSVKSLASSLLSPSATPPPVSALFSLESGEIRYRLDGVDPTATEGHILAMADTLVLEGVNTLRQFRAIKTGENEGTLRVSYFR